MNKQINQIIDELVSLDPEFGKHREQLEKILMQILAAKPAPAIDAQFVASLREQLFAKMENKPSMAANWSALKNNFMKKLILSSAAALVVIAAVAGGLYSNIFKTITNTPATKLGGQVKITRAADGAFGSLENVSIQAKGMGGGGGGAESTAASPAIAPDMALGKGGGGGSAIMPPYQPVTYKYVYKGEDLNLTSAKLDVLKKVKPSFDNSASGFDNFGLGLINLASFAQSKVQSINFNQDNGYNINVDLINGMVSVSGFYGDVYPTEKQMCSPEAGCPQPKPLSKSDVPDDATLISIADQFLSDHSILKDSYDAPVVLVDPYAKMSGYVPDAITVIYPLKIQDGVVYDESGNKSGLNVSVNLRNKKVMGVYNLTTNDYEASSYDAVTDPVKILQVAQKGGMYGYIGDGTGKIVEIDLGTPTLQYVQMWDWNSNYSQQMLVPSLIFPVTKQPTDGSFYREAVVVPLVKNILERDNGGPINIMDSTTPPSATK